MTWDGLALSMGMIILGASKGPRHEMLNETNRDEVTRDIVAWMRKTLGI